MEQASLSNQSTNQIINDTLNEDNVDPNPIKQFQKWFLDAQTAKVREPNAMTVSTCTKSGIPSSRILLLKSVDNTGFVFFTNYNSKKSQDLIENPKAALLFYWDILDREVRIEGDVVKVSKEESEAYFKSRPYQSQIGAWASPNQSSVIKDREELDNYYKGVEMKFKDQEVPKPDFWGGWRLKPSSVEFCQSKSTRMDDRIIYTKENDDDKWIIQRLCS